MTSEVTGPRPEWRRYLDDAHVRPGKNRLVGYGATVMYSYNGDGLRVGKKVGTATQHFTWDLAEGLPLLLDDGTTSYVYGPGGTPLEQIADRTPAPITLIGKGNAAVTANNMITVPISGSVLPNDQILVSVTEDGNDAVSAPGYTVVKMESTTNQLIPTATTLFRRTAAGGETGATFTFAKAEPEATAVAVVYRGVDPANPTGPVDGPSFNATGNAAATTLQVAPGDTFGSDRSLGEAWNGKPWSTSTTTDATRSTFNGASCPSSAFCLAIGSATEKWPVRRSLCHPSRSRILSLRAELAMKPHELVIAAGEGA